MRTALLLTLGALMACGEPTAATAPAAVAADTKPASAPAKAAGHSAGLPDVVATIGGEPVTAADLEDAAGAQIFQLKMQMHQAYEGALNQLIDKRLQDAEAAKRGISVEDLIKAEVTDKAGAPTDEDIEKFFNENKARMGGSSLEDVKPRIAQYLGQQKQTEAQAAFIKSLRDAAKVEVKLEPFRAEVVAGDAVRKGSESAPVEIIEFSDFQCPYCTRGAQTVDKVVEHYGDKVTVVFRHFPLPFHKDAPLAAQAAIAAGKQGKFWQMHDELFANMKKLKADDLNGYATKIGLNMTKFNSDLNSDETKAMVKRDQALAAQGTSG